uniref:Uncharacterized protein n=1 Tax=Cucumis melo TaxID=3656 RepID=A0A9I9EJL8_CUCME
MMSVVVCRCHLSQTAKYRGILSYHWIEICILRLCTRHF